MRLLTLDFEFHDPNLLKYGIGWAFKYNYPSYYFNILGYGYIDSDGNSGYSNDYDKLSKLLETHDSLLCHNYLCEWGILFMLAKEGIIEFNLRKHMKYDTMLLAKLENANRYSYGLDHLGTTILKQSKSSSDLHDYAWDSGLYQKEKTAETGRGCKTRPSDAVLEKWCKCNIHLLPEKVVGDYCIQDCKLTLDLFNNLLPKVEYIGLKRYSDLQEICIDSKARGVCIDLKRAKEVYTDFIGIKEKTATAIYAVFNGEFNIGSPKQLAERLIHAGYKLPMTDKGSYSTKKSVLESLVGDEIALILKYRQAVKMSRDFVGKIIDYQNTVPMEYRDEDRGILFPSMHILGATATGRFSSGGRSKGCKEISIHQIPARDEVFGKPCRSIFIPFEGDTWGCLDYNSQESRLQVHYADMLKCDGVADVVEEWNNNPLMSFHDKVAEIANIIRRHAKDINLGISYGMGKASLYAKLGLNEIEGNKILTQYHELLPFMLQLQNKCKKAFKSNRYIKTIGGRKIKLPPAYIKKGAERDGLSRLIQGSAADQTMAAMEAVWDAGISILFTVHDEINISSKHINKDMAICRDMMENAYKLTVPVIADTGKGDSWLGAK